MGSIGNPALHEALVMMTFASTATMSVEFAACRGVKTVTLDDAPPELPARSAYAGHVPAAAVHAANTLRHLPAAACRC